MAESDGMEIDPAIAAAMGFAGFGGTKKRKQGVTDNAFVDPETSKQAKAVGRQGANNVPLGIRNATGGSGGPSVAPIINNAAAGGVTDASAESQRPDDGLSASTLVGNASLQDLRQGVQNGRGDTVYFLPSFLEDPWKDLQAP